MSAPHDLDYGICLPTDLLPGGHGDELDHVRISYVVKTIRGLEVTKAAFGDALPGNEQLSELATTGPSVHDLNRAYRITLDNHAVHSLASDENLTLLEILQAERTRRLASIESVVPALGLRLDRANFKPAPTSTALSEITGRVAVHKIVELVDQHYLFSITGHELSSLRECVTSTAKPTKPQRFFRFLTGKVKNS